MRIVNIVNEVVHDLLGHVQTLAILLAALIAADFFVFTPTVTSTVVQEYRVNPSTVTDAYKAAGEELPAVVLATLSDLVNRSVPIGQSATVVNGGASASTQSSQSAVSAPSAAAPVAVAGGPYPMTEICARSRAIVESVFAGACTVGLQLNLPLQDRALLHYDEESGLPLDTARLQTAVSRLAAALFARATVTLTNPSKSTAQNVNIVMPDGYSLKAGTLPTSLKAGGTTDFRYESQPGALGSTQSAMVTNPTFTVRWDPTGPLDPEFTMRAFLFGIALLVVLGVLDTIQAIAKGSDSTTDVELGRTAE